MGCAGRRHQPAICVHGQDSSTPVRLAASLPRTPTTGIRVPTWSSFFYEKGGGSMPDLGVYNITSLTGLLGPAKSVVAMVSIVTPTRQIDEKGEIKVTEEDNAMVILDHGNGMLSHIQCGFNYFNPNGHDGSNENRHTISIVGSKGSLGMVGYDWMPLGVEFATDDHPDIQRFVHRRRGLRLAARGVDGLRIAWRPARNCWSRPSMRCTWSTSCVRPASRKRPAGGSI